MDFELLQINGQKVKNLTLEKIISNIRDSLKINLVLAQNEKNAVGVNDQIELLEAEKIMQDRLRKKFIKKGDILIVESTVYPGVTREMAIEHIQMKRNLEINKDVYIGYSPERINPGDRKHQIENTKKIKLSQMVMQKQILHK